MRVLCSLLLLFACTCGLAQERCATNLVSANKLRNESREEFEQWLHEKESLRQSAANAAVSVVYEIPVVFHILHDGSEVGSGTNIPDEKIYEQIKILNADFRRTNEDAGNTPSVFEPVAADTEIQFVLARQDPEGLPTTGIVRLEGAKSIYAPTDDAAMMSESSWDQDLYLNIYVTDLTGSNLGYAQFPFSNLEGIASELENYKSTDGLVLDYQWVGTNENTGSFDSYGRTATHELGHYLGLRHIWGDGGCGFDDYCDDTPLAENYTTGCPSDKQTCGSLDMIQNYMDYTDDVCMNLYTACQKERMRTVLELSPRRKSLLTSPGLQDPVLTTNDLGIRSVISPLQSACASEIIPGIEVRNYGSNPIASFEIRLSINDITEATRALSIPLSTGASTTVTFDPIILDDQAETSLSFTITSVNGATGNNSLNDTKTVIISPFANEIIPYFEDFESNKNYSSKTENGQTSTWTYTTAPANTVTNQAAVAPYFNQEANFGVQDLLVSRTLDLSGLTSAQLDFKYAYASRLQENSGFYYLDGLIVAVSTNCGEDFDREDYLMERYGNSLQTSGTTAFSFTPSEDGDWENMSFNITEFAGESQVQIAFIGINGSGNNLYIDDISVSSANLPALDAGLREITNLPIVSCSTDSHPLLEVKNYGYTTITELEFDVTVNGETSTVISDGLSIASGASESFTVDLSGGILPGENEVAFQITGVNGVIDENSTNNGQELLFLIEDTEEQIPVKEDFENDMTWTTFGPEGSSLYQTAVIGNNTVLYTDNYNNEYSGKSYLVSPVITSAGNTEASVRFRYSYARRQDLNDNLKVLLSLDCGKTFTRELLSLNSDQMAVTTSSAVWEPSGHDDWKSVSIDLSDYTAWPELRIAFLFSNGGGNRLYLDDINVLRYNDPLLPDLWALDEQVVVYPNPASQEFSAAFNLASKQTVRVRLVDMAGRTVLDQSYTNILNDKIIFQTPAQSGFYVLYLSGKSLDESKRVFIRR